MENTVKSTVTTENLKEEVELLTQKNNILEHEKAELEQKLKWFEEQFRLHQHRLFGRSSEKTPIPEQINLFNEAESEANPKIPEPTIEEITYKRKKKQGHREEMLKNLPVETIEYKLPEEEQICKCCGGKLHEMSTETRREIEVIPAQVKVVEHVRYVYGCRDCEKNEITTPIVTSPMPAPTLPGSIASASAIAHVMVQKYVFGLPLYRLEQQWKLLDIEISRQAMANWVILAATRWLILIFNRMHELLLQRDIIHADESTLQVLHEPGRAADTKSYMWLYRTGRDGPSIVLYEYQTTRAGKHVVKFLEGFKGRYLCTDGYAGYNLMSGIIRVCCWSHARRKFDEALKALPKTEKDKHCAAMEGLEYCNKIFGIERELHDVTSEERYEKRLEKSKPVLDEFHTWLKQQRARLLPKSATGVAVRYCLDLWEELTNFLLDGRLYVDNNISERSFKSYILSRKNFLFCNTPKGATASAMVFSVLRTAIENGLKPFEYMKYLLEQLPNSDVKEQSVLDSLLPWSESIPEYCKVSDKSLS
jgi:transposase